MKWNQPAGSTQGTTDGKYVIVQANSQHWIAYALSPYATGEPLGSPQPTDELARQACEDHEREMVALRKAG